MKYTLEWLSEEFQRHNDEYRSGESYDKDAFNLPLALKTIVDGLIEMDKQMIQMNKDIRKLDGWHE